MVEVTRVSRDLDIGKPTNESVTVTDMDTLISNVKVTADKFDESIEELKKIKLGTGLVTGVDLNEGGE